MSGFEAFEKQYGLPTQSRALDEHELAAIREKLPADLVEYFRRRGVGHFDGGLFRTVNPPTVAEVIGAWGEPRAHHSTYLITAFGCFAYWDGSNNLFVNVWAGTTTRLFDNVADVFEGTLCDAGFIRSVLLRAEFRHAAQRLGAPADDECFGFFPAIALGGDGSPGTIRKVKLREHLALLAQLVD